MITIFSCPKPFDSHIDIIQRNANQSWKLLHPDVEIILFGNEKGTKEVTKEFGIRHIPEILRNEFGTPLINDLFEQGQKNARHNILCYVNADIILLNNFIKSISRVSQYKKDFLLIGQRWDVNIWERISFEKNWEYSLIDFTRMNGSLSSHYAIDYFVFPKECLHNIPPFAIGRPAWDNWFIYNARKEKLRVIDGTAAIFAIHQNHDYSHVKNRIGNSWEGPEAEQNRILAGGYSHLYSIRDTNYILTENLKIKYAIKNQLYLIIKPFNRLIARIWSFIIRNIKKNL